MEKADRALKPKLQALRTGLKTCGRPRLLALDQLDFVAIRVLNEGDDAAAVSHRSRRPRNLNPFPLEHLANAIDVWNPDREMTETAADLVRLLASPVMSELDDSIVLFITI